MVALVQHDTWSTADLSDEHGDALAVCELPLIRYGGVRAFGGEIATIRCQEDNVLVRDAVSSAGHGRVLVVDGGGSLRVALVGDQLAELARQNGWAGLVIHGAVRDAGRLRELELGLVALGTCPRRSRKDGKGDVDVPVRFGSVTFAPQGTVYVDEDGIVVRVPDPLR